MLKAAVLGLGRFGASTALALCESGAEVLAVDKNERLVNQVAANVTVAVAFDATDPVNLQAYDISQMDVVIVAIGTNFEASVLVTMQCKKLKAPGVYAKALNDMQEAVLLQVGADHVIKPEEDMGRRLAEHLLHDSVVDFVELPKGFSLRRISVPQDWVGRSLAELALLSERGLNLIQVLRTNRSNGSGGDGPVRIAIPDGSVILEADDQIDVIGADKELRKFGKPSK